MLREALPLEKLPSNMEAPTEPAKTKKIPTKRQTCNTKDKTVMKRTRNHTRQFVSYHRRTYKKEAKPRKLKRLAAIVYGKLYP